LTRIKTQLKTFWQLEGQSLDEAAGAAQLMLALELMVIL